MNLQCILVGKTFNKEHLETVNDETQFEPLGQNDTDTVNPSEDKVFFYSINDESEENKNQQQRTGDICDAKNIKADKSPDDSNVLGPTTAISTSEDSKMMQRPPSHITVANWTKENTPTRNMQPLGLKVNTFKRNASKKKQTNDLGIADITEKTSPFNINIESTSESKHVENENNYLLKTKNIDGIEPNKDLLCLGVSEDNTDSKGLHAESEDGSCMDCIKPVQVKTWKEINQGDHIILSRSFNDRHAIVIRVIPPEDDNSQQISFELIHQTNKGDIRDSCRRRGPIVKLKRKTETVDLKTVMICKYWGRIKPKSPEEIVIRATEALYGDQEEFRYDVFDNNCEHFASWCVTGRRLSIQIRKASTVLKILYRKGFRGLSDELLRNKVEYEHGMLCETCFERNEKMLSVARKKVLQKVDIQKGDIIWYRYYKLMHCSVVLDVIKRKEKYIKCEIAHYAFKGPFKKKKIQSDILKVPFDGSVSLFDYSSDEFITYEPGEVVSRAKERIGEQMFAYFSNDSSHFARWCKLKLPIDPGIANITENAIGIEKFPLNNESDFTSTELLLMEEENRNLLETNSDNGIELNYVLDDDTDSNYLHTSLQSIKVDKNEAGKRLYIQTRKTVIRTTSPRENLDIQLQKITAQKERQDPEKDQTVGQSGTPHIETALFKNKNKSEKEQTRQLKGSWFYKLVFSCDGKMVNIDSCESNRTCSNNGKWLLDVISKGQNEISKYMNSLLALKGKEFEILLMFSTLFKKNLISPEDWLLSAVKHQHNMACYMILAYMTGTEKEKQNVILPALKMAMDEGDKYITKSISWFIIKEFLKSFSFDMNSLLDIWPAVVCKNMNCKDSNFCSQDLIILIETEQPSHVLPIQFWNIEIKYLSEASETELKKEATDHVYRNTKFTGSASVEVCFPEKFNIDGKFASKLFKDHCNLTLICKSVYALKDGIKTYCPCVQLFCRSKGLIPVEENHFPKFINNVKTDVLEGESLLAGRLRVGEQVNSKHFSGTLGGFVKVLGKMTFLTCAHVVVNKDNLSGHNLTIPSNEAIYIDYVQTLPNSLNSKTQCCGEVRYIEFKTDSPGETSIDAALIKLKKGIEINEDDFIANKSNNKHHLQFLGMKSPFLNENWLDHEKIFYGKSALQFINVTVGAVSGISVNTHSTKEKDEGFDIDRETVIETYQRIVRSENVSTFSSNAPVFSNDAHLQVTRLSKVDKERTRYRLSRRMYNQIAVTHIPFQQGDSGTCIYVCDNSLERYGCIGMATANHPGIDGGAIVTPMKDILKTFHVDIH